MYSRSSIWYRGTSACAFVPVFGTGENQNVPSFRFFVPGNIRQNHPFGNNPFANPRNMTATSYNSQGAKWGWMLHGDVFQFVPKCRFCPCLSSFVVFGARTGRNLDKQGGQNGTFRDKLGTPHSKF